MTTTPVLHAKPINMAEATFKVIFDPTHGWELVRDAQPALARVLLGHTLWMAAIAPICALYATTQVGWSIGGGDPVTLTVNSAVPIAFLFFLASVTATLCVAKSIQWMAQTYCDPKPLGHCLALASLTATPIYMVGFALLYPILWLNLLIGLPALAFAVHLFYTGVPIMMNIDRERGFLFSSAVLCFGLVTLVALLVATVLLWGSGFSPEFRYGELS